MKKTYLLFGTRPEAVKVCLLVRPMREGDRLEPHDPTSLHRVTPLQPAPEPAPASIRRLSQASPRREPRQAR